MDQRDKTVLLNKEDVKDLLEENKNGYLIVLSGNMRGRMFLLDQEHTLIGRAPNANIRLEDDGVSRIHAEILQDDGFILKDCNSTNGTYCNNDKIKFHYLVNGDQIRVGTATILKFSYQNKVEEAFQRELFDSATRDGLTKIFNKQYFHERLQKELNLTKRHNSPLSLILFDIDHFKKVNDVYGHLAGDMVLKELAALLTKQLRNEDLFARTGGEEFSILLPQANLEQAALYAERARKAVEEYLFVYEGKNIPITISLGVSDAVIDNCNIGDEFIEVADKRLYKAKNNGRNQVCSSN